MPNAQGLPQTGEEVQFADGTTNAIKRYVRTRAIGADGQGYIVEMAKPFKHEYVTVVAYAKTGFWAAWEPALEADQRYEATFEVDAATRDRLVNGKWDLPWYQRHTRAATYLVATGLYLFGVIMGAIGMAVWLSK
jgi:hypothetical protein